MKRRLCVRNCVRKRGSKLTVRLDQDVEEDDSVFMMVLGAEDLVESESEGVARAF